MNVLPIVYAAIALAMLYPEPEKGGRGKKTVLKRDGFSKQRLSDARSILRYSQGLAEDVLAGRHRGPVRFDATTQSVRALPQFEHRYRRWISGTSPRPASMMVCGSTSTRRRQPALHQTRMMKPARCVVRGVGRSSDIGAARMQKTPAVAGRGVARLLVIRPTVRRRPRHGLRGVWQQEIRAAFGRGEAVSRVSASPAGMGPGSWSRAWRRVSAEARRS